jgi:hypothetical protein
MKDYAIPINDVDTLIAHFAEWVRFLDAKGQELEAQLAKLEASKKKKSNGMEPPADVLDFQKVCPLTAPISADPVRESASPKSMDWLDDGGGSSEDIGHLVPPGIPQPGDYPMMDVPTLDENNPSDEADEPDSDTSPASRSDTEDDKDFDWLKRK